MGGLQVTENVPLEGTPGLHSLSFPFLLCMCLCVVCMGPHVHMCVLVHMEAEVARPSCRSSGAVYLVP